MGKETSTEIWKSLVQTFERKGVASQLYLRRRLLTTQFENDTNLEAHFIKFDELIRQLKSDGTKLEKNGIVCHLLWTMPET
jgi:cysteine synthase